MCKLSLHFIVICMYLFQLSLQGQSMSYLEISDTDRRFTSTPTELSQNVSLFNVSDSVSEPSNATSSSANSFSSKCGQKRKML